MQSKPNANHEAPDQTPPEAKESRPNELGTGSIGKLMIKLAVPTIIAQLINAMYNIVDRMYIGHMEGVGDLALTGVGVTFPIIMLISAFSALIGMGGAPLASIEMGKGNLQRAQHILGNAFSVLLGLAVVLTGVFLLFKEPLLYMFGASQATIEYALPYISIYVAGTVFVMLSLGLNMFITTQGFAKTGMLTILIGALLNIVLDPIFIFVLNMGVQGAALATILSQAVSALWVLRFLMGEKTHLRIQKKYMRPQKTIMLPVLALGISPFIMQSTESLVMITLNSGLQRYGNDLYVGAMTIISSVMMVLNMPISGLAQGTQPIISYNYGAGNIERVKKTYKLLIFSTFTVSTLLCLTVELFPGFFVSIFNNRPELMEITVRSMRVYMAGMFMMGLQLGCQQSFMAMGQAKISLFLALLRKIVLLIPLAMVFPMFWGAPGIFIAEPVADIIASLITGLMFWRFTKKMFSKKGVMGV